jgi:hypothetical protein
MCERTGGGGARGQIIDPKCAFLNHRQTGFCLLMIYYFNGGANGAGSRSAP